MSRTVPLPRSQTPETHGVVVEVVDDDEVELLADVLVLVDVVEVDVLVVGVVVEVLDEDEVELLVDELVLVDVVDVDVVLEVDVVVEVVDEDEVELLVDVLVVVDVVEVDVLLVVVVGFVVVVVVGHTSITVPPPSVVSTGSTQLSSIRACGEPPSGHVPALAMRNPNLPVALAMQVASSGAPFAAALA